MIRSITSQVLRDHLRTPKGNAAGPLASRAGVSLPLLGVGRGSGLGTAPARGADWQSGRRRPGNGSGFSGGRDPPEEAAAAARAARGERRERRAAAAVAERAHGRSSARPHELRRGGCLRVPGPAWRLLSGLAGAGREPPGLSVPERCECSPLASKVWSRQRQTPVLSSSRCPDPRAALASCPRCSAIRGVREASEPWRRLQTKGSFSFWSFPPSSSSAPFRPTLGSSTAPSAEERCHSSGGSSSSKSKSKSSSSSRHRLSTATATELWLLRAPCGLKALQAAHGP